MGDPLGIGPEVVVKALETYALAADDDRLARFVILGSERPLRGAAERAGVAPFWATLDFAPSPHAWDALPLPEASVVLLDHPLDERAVPSAPGPFFVAAGRSNEVGSIIIAFGNSRAYMHD